MGNFGHCLVAFEHMKTSHLIPSDSGQSIGQVTHGDFSNVTGDVCTIYPKLAIQVSRPPLVAGGQSLC